MSPQTSPERASRWPGMDAEAIAFLESRGYRLTRAWTWLLPDEREADAIAYLIEEWDFGGVAIPSVAEGRPAAPSHLGR